ncbi:MAG: CvpA family protein [Rickettsiales bacterium]|jgi:membrane protein required for colicin V production|nr:CvpA family protein [Rickettsiales bacterium]
MFTFLDFIFFAAVAVSAVLAYYGGFVAEAFGVAAWIGAAFATKYIYPSVQPKFADWFGANNMFSAIAAYVSVFVAIVMALSFVNKWATGKLRRTHFDGIDHSLGFFFGLVRGVLVMALLYIAALWFIPEKNDRPKWITEARSKSVLKVTSMFITALLPDGGNFSELKKIVRGDMTGGEIDTFEKLAKPEVGGGDSSSAEEGYRASEIRELERQLQQIEQLEADFK